MNEARYVLGNGVVADGIGVFLEDGAVAVADGKIAGIGGSDELRRWGWNWIDVGGRLILPGLVNMHHHFYSHFATGLIPHGRPSEFADILKGLWWPLDAVIDGEGAYWSGRCGAMDALSHGVTTVFDHHASMNCVDGVLDVLSDGIEKAGIRAVLCLEISDRLGKRRVEEQLDENLRFWEATRSSCKRRGMLGLHANLTISEETMAYLSRKKPEEMAVHVHCGEAVEDYEYCLSMGYGGPVARLDSFDLLSDDSLLIHCIHLSDRDYEIIGRKRPAVVTNPESNANNRVGSMDRGRIGSFLLGTDGMSNDMIASLRSAFLLERRYPSPWEGLSEAFFPGRYAYVRKFFPEVAGLEVGGAADLAVLDYIPLTPVSPGSLLPHLIFGAKGGKAFLTAVGGEILWREGRYTDSESQSVYLRVREVSRDLHRRFYGSDWDVCLKWASLNERDETEEEGY